jgi:hypothetical protein
VLKSKLMCIALLGFAQACITVAAADRPFLATTSAAAEEDDDQVWTLESWVQRVGSQRGFSIAAEYAFDPTTSVQLEFMRAHDRGTGETDREVEIEFKHLFNHIARDGYGWGVAASLGLDKSEGHGWTGGGASLTVPFTLQLWQGDGLLHLNGGVEKARDTRRAWSLSAAIERTVFRHTTLFAELARTGDTTVLHGGVRHWIKREKLALDLSAQRVRRDGTHETGVVLGLGWYDL